MMKTKPLLFAATLLLAACGSGEDGEGNRFGSTASSSSIPRGGAAAPSAPSAPIAAGDSLTGLYERRDGGLASQLCIVERAGAAARFGLNVWGANMHSCSGAGTAVRDGNGLTLTMEGDRTCAVAARIEGNTIRLPDDLPEGCSYYCGARARMAGVSLARIGTTQADALKARDVVDEPLCDAPRN